jgi:hypothetical protein
MPTQPPWHRPACEHIADPFNDDIDEVRIAHIQRSDGWIETTWNNMTIAARSPQQGPKSRKAASRHGLPAPVWWTP